MRNMIDILQKITAFFKIAETKQKRNRHKSTGQSMVEFGIALPLLIFLFTGMVEFGFMLNTYLSLQDAVRTAGRQFSNENPLMKDANGVVVDDLTFYSNAAQAVVDALNLNAKQIVVDQTRDNVLVSVLTIRVNEAATPDAIESITRHPQNAQFFRLYPATSPNSVYGDVQITNYLTANNSVPVDMGLLIIEVFYSYEGVLHLPWTEPFFSEVKPATLYSSTIVPLVSVKP